MAVLRRPALWRAPLLGGLAVLLAAVLGPTAPALAKVFDPVSFTLDNGMQVVVVVNRRAPIVHHSVWYRVGAADETAGESGLAHFLEHLMFKGTDTTTPSEFSDIITAPAGP